MFWRLDYVKSFVILCYAAPKFEKIYYTAPKFKDELMFGKKSGSSNATSRVGHVHRHIERFWEDYKSKLAIIYVVNQNIIWLKHHERVAKEREDLVCKRNLLIGRHEKDCYLKMRRSKPSSDGN